MKPLLNMIPVLKGSLECSVQGKQKTYLYMHLKEDSFECIKLIANRNI